MANDKKHLTGEDNEIVTDLTLTVSMATLLKKAMMHSADQLVRGDGFCEDCVMRMIKGLLQIEEVLSTLNKLPDPNLPELGKEDIEARLFRASGKKARL